MPKEFADFPRGGNRVDICSISICSAFGDIERISDTHVRCKDHGTVFDHPVEILPEKGSQMIDPDGMQL